MNKKIYNIISLYGIRSYNDLTDLQRNEIAVVFLKDDGLNYILEGDDNLDCLSYCLIHDLEHNNESMLVSEFTDKLLAYYKSDVESEIYDYCDHIDSESFYGLCSKFGSIEADYRMELSI